MAVRHDYDPKAMMVAKQREAAKPGRAKPAGRGSGLTPKIRRAIELMVFGDEHGKRYPSDREAAAAANVTLRTLREAMRKPAVEAHYNAQMVAKRHGLKAIGLGVIEDVMTNDDLRKTAAGNKVRTDAAKVVLVDAADAQVNIQINNSVKVTPGYVIDLSEEKPRMPVLEAEVVEES